MRGKNIYNFILCILVAIAVLTIYIYGAGIGGYIKSNAGTSNDVTPDDENRPSEITENAPFKPEETPEFSSEPTPAFSPVPTPTPMPTSVQEMEIKPISESSVKSTPTVTEAPSSTPQNKTTPPKTTPKQTAVKPQPTIKPSPTPSSSPVKDKGKIKVLGFTTYYNKNDTKSYKSMSNYFNLIDEIAAHSPVTDGQGNITGLISTAQIDLSYEKNIKPYVLIGNNFDGKIAKTLLESPANRKNFISNLLNLMEKYKYKGVNIDLEGVYSENRNHYTAFIKEIYQALKPKGYVVTASVPAKTSDNPKNSWNGAYDYAALSNYVDALILMAYDEHWSGGDPGPVASYGWVQKVLSYAVTVVPSEKIYLGVAAYGYDWPDNGNRATAYGINGFYNLASKYNVDVKWHSTYKTPYFNYVDEKGIKHSAWFENAQSLGYKLDLAKNYNIGGIAIWCLGLENSDYWGMIQQKLK